MNHFVRYQVLQNTTDNILEMFYLYIPHSDGLLQALCHSQRVVRT